MNKVELLGRLTRVPDIRYSNSEESIAVARFNLAVERRHRKDGQTEADFISCVAFGRSAEFAEKYLHKGTKIVLVGRIQTGNYTNQDGQKIYTTDVVAEEMYFAESKKEGSDGRSEPTDENGFMNIPEGIDEELPFN